MDFVQGGRLARSQLSLWELTKIPTRAVHAAVECLHRIFIRTRPLFQRFSDNFEDICALGLKAYAYRAVSTFQGVRVPRGVDLHVRLFWQLNDNSILGL